MLKNARANMNYNDYNLVSFGDSFTFGDNSHESNIDMRGKIPLTEYKERCNMYSYPRYLTKSLNFKQDINRGIAGSSNKSTLSEIISFHQFHKNSREKYFYTVNLTSPYREFFLPSTKYKNKIHDDVIITKNITFTNLTKHMTTDDNSIISLIRPNSWHDIVNYYNSDITVIHNHILNVVAIRSYLENNSIPYVMFDGISDVLEYESTRVSETGKSIYEIIHLHRDTQPESLHVIKEFFQGVRNKKYKNYLNMYNYDTLQDKNIQSVIEKSFKCQSLWKLIIEYAKYIKGDEKFYNSKKQNDNHWHTNGHELAANIIEMHIKNIYGEK